MKRAVLRRKHRVRKKLTYMYLKLNRSTKMKDSNDAQTIDWVDEVEVVSKEVATPDLGFHITENAALDKALNRIVNITLQDLLAEYN